MLNIPNTLTLLRILAIPVFLILLVDFRYGEALAVFIAAGVTDALDGAIARLTHTKTALGANLDPAADKLLLVSAFIALAFMNQVPRWLTVVVLLRDVTLIAGYLLLFLMTQETIEVRPSAVGKLSTALQLASVATALVTLAWRIAIPGGVQSALFYTTAAATSIAGLQYMYRGLAWLQARQPAPPGR